MNMLWQSILLGEILTERQEVPSAGALASGEIRIVAKISFNDGKIQLRADGQTKTGMILIRPGDLVISGVNAAKGAIAVYDEGNTEPIAATIHYGAYIPNRRRVHLKYLWWLLRSQMFRDLLLEYIPGGIKTELKAKRFLPIPVPLPPLPEQLRIVARIEELAAKIHEVRTLRYQAAEEAESLIASCLMHMFDDAVQSQTNQTRLGDVCSFQGGSQPVKLHFAYAPRDGYVRLIQIRDYKSDDYLTFVPHDSVRKFCSSDDVMIGRYGPPIFQILRGIEGAYNVALMKAIPDTNRISKEFLFYLLKEPRLFQKVEEDSQRTSGQTGVRKELLENHITFVPPLPKQRSIVTYLDELQAKVNTLKPLQEETKAGLEAMLPSILDKAFKGEL